MMSQEPVELLMRQGLRGLAKTVVAITTRFSGQRYAMAATAVSELSINPPSLPACVNKGASIHSPISEATKFCNNILRRDDFALANMQGSAPMSLPPDCALNEN